MQRFYLLGVVLVVCSLSGCKGSQTTLAQKPSVAAKPAKNAPQQATSHSPTASPSKGNSTSTGKTSPSKPSLQSIDFFYFAEFEGRLLPCMVGKKSQGGFLYLASLLHHMKSARMLVLSTGNLFQGNEPRYNPLIKALNMINLTASALGNLELNQGIGYLKQQLSKAQFAILSANVYQGKERLLPAYIIRQCGPLRVGIIGVTSQDTAVQVPTEYIQGLVFRPPVAEVQKCVAQLRGQADFIIALSNLDVQDDVKLAEAVPELNLIIGRSSYKKKVRLQQVGQSVIVRLSKKRGLELGKYELTCVGSKIIGYNNKIYQIGRDTKDLQGVPLDASAQELVAQWRRRKSRREQVLCRTKVILQGSRQQIRTRETNLGDLITDIMLQAHPQAQVAFINSGAIRADIPCGTCTYGMLEDALPYKNHLVLLAVKGEVIKEILENSTSRIEKPAGCFLQVAGIRFTFDPTREPFDRVGEILIQGQPLQPQRIYKVITVDYIADGGDDFLMLKEQTRLWKSTQTIQQYVAAYLRKHGVINPQVEGRIRIVKRR